MPDNRDPVKALREAMEDSEEHLRALPGRDDSIADVTISLLDARALLRLVECMEQCRSCTNPVCDGCRYDWRAAKERR